VLMNLKRSEAALASYDKVLATRPDFAEAFSNRGLALIDLKRHEEALASCEKALVLKPDYAEGHYNRGIALVNLGRLREALASDDKALALKPDFAEAHCNRGVVLHALERLADALTSFDEALAQKPDYAVALYNRGNALIDLQRPAEALASYDKALSLKPDFAEVLCNRGLALVDLKCPQDALASYDGAIALKPHYAEARYGRSLCLLLQGDYVSGWREYEWRRESKRTQQDKRSFAQPLWLGDEDLTDRTILLHFDQGYGDTIQFCRYAKLVTCRGARVLLEVQPALRSLISSIDRSVQVIAIGDALPDFDYHCPLMSLPLALKTSLNTIPATCPYLFAAPESKKRWHDRLGVGVKPRIGLAWAGNPRLGDAAANRMDRQRSVAFDQLAPLFESTHCEFHSLQKGDDAIAQLQGSAHRRRVVDWTDELRDFADTAALIANLDLIITVDTAVAHLAGALGKPIWLMNRFNTCWRWLLDREDSPWYPTARIFRQPSQGDWTSVTESAAVALRQWSDASPAPVCLSSPARPPNTSKPA
jgi:tetratricopeptide (TPR) repeat protein